MSSAFLLFNRDQRLSVFSLSFNSNMQRVRIASKLYNTGSASQLMLNGQGSCNLVRISLGIFLCNVGKASAKTYRGVIIPALKVSEL